MEDDVVLSDKMHELGIFRFPPCLPCLWKKFLSIGDISDRCVKPYIKHLALRALYRHRDTPVQVTADCARLEASVDPALALAIDIASPLLVTVKYPFRKPLFVLIQRKVPMLGLLLHKLPSAECRLRIDQFIWAEGCSTLLTLVAIRTLRAATWACTGDITVSKESLGLLVIVLLAHLLDELALIIKLPEESRCILMVRLGRCSRIYVEIDSKSCK